MITKLPRETIMRIDSIPEDDAVESYMPSKQKHSISQELFKRNEAEGTEAILNEIGTPKEKLTLGQTILMILGILAIILVGALLTVLALSINVQIGK